MEYRYITQEVIDSGGRNISSPEMFEEARQYNIEAADNYNRRHRAHALFNIWMVVQFVYYVFKVLRVLSDTTMKQFGDGSYTPDILVWLGVLAFFGYIGLMIWFAYIKHCRNRFIIALISLVVIAVSWRLWLIPVGNFFMTWYYEYVEADLSKKLGYPSFTQLNITTFNSYADSVENLTFDSIREKANRDHPHNGEFL